MTFCKVDFERRNKFLRLQPLVLSLSALVLLYRSIPGHKVGVEVVYLGHDAQKLFLDIHTSDLTADRPRKMINTIFRNELIQNGTIIPRFVIPKGHQHVKGYPTLETTCDKQGNGESGLPCRIEQGYATFLNEYPTINWYFRAIDDTYISPEAIIRRIESLNSFVTPWKHIVVKGMLNPRHKTERIHGGSGWLISRGTLEFMAEQGLKVDAYAHLGYRQLDDTTFSIFLWEIFENASYWSDPFFTSCEVEDKKVIASIDKMVTSNFQEGLSECKKSWNLVPLNKIIAFHTTGHDSFIQLATLAEKAPDNVYVQENSYPFNICKARAGLSFHSDGMDYLKTATPLKTKSNYTKIVPIKKDVMWE